MMSEQPSLAGLNAVVTGASSGIGEAIARLYARHGAHVVIHYRRSREAAVAVAAEVRAQGGRASVVQADLATETASLVEQCWQRLGRVHVWVNNAGADILTGEHSRLPPEQRLLRLIEVDLLGTLHCCWDVAPRMREAGGGVILNMSWDLAQQGMTGANPEMFAAAKGAISAFSRSLARSYAPRVRVNNLAPGWIETTFAREVMSRDAYRRVAAHTPMQRFGLPQEVAAAALFLASPEAAYITGQTLRINGGTPSP